MGRPEAWQRIFGSLGFADLREPTRLILKALDALDQRSVVIEQVNGVPVLSVPDIGMLLRDQAGKLAFEAQLITTEAERVKKRLIANCVSHDW